MIRFPQGIDAQSFLRDYWQQKPLLIRQGIPDFHPPMDGDELAGLSLEEEVESRLVLEQGFEHPWELHHGPFTEEDFSRLPTTPWTLLVQGVDLWVPEVRAMIDEFSFLPRWRMDDIMVSYANDSGSVGAHFDYYDVFLIQGMGRRRWSIGGRCDETTPLMEGTALKILDEFNATESWVLEPGDILYLPPCIAHHGVAEGECMTYSLGFRSPTAGEMLDDLATEVLSRGGGYYYRDPPLTPEMATAAITPEFVRQVKQLLASVLDNEQLLGEWFASYMTRPKYQDMDMDDPELQRKAISPGANDKPGKTYINGLESE
ncbi:MAG: cupin domain-containing protein [Porticoccaceae bacterium]|nr:cupin domain-containing protein [Porticoccaceae bacterium]